MDHPSIVERVSNTSLPDATVVVEAFGDDGKPYAEVKTPTAFGNDIEGGALRPGGAPNLYAKENIGLLGQYAAIGIIYGTLYGVTYPFLNNYLRMTGTETASAGALILMPWTWKMFFGIVSDCYPIFGYRRRPYIVIGWLVSFVACFIMAVLPIGDPKYRDPSIAFILEEDLTDDQRAMINNDAPSTGVKYIAMLALANLGCVIAYTASDGILVNLAQREPENLRGTTQSMVYVVQVLFMCLSTAMIGFGMNSADYGGTFSSAMGFNAVMGVCAFASLLIIPISWYCMTEEKADRQSGRAYFGVLYDLIQHRVVYQIIAFRFFRNLFSYFSVTAEYPIQSLWAGVTPVNNSTATIIGYFAAAAGYYATAKIGLNWNWRSMIVVTQVVVIVIDCIPTLITIWDVYRAQWLWLGGPIIQYLPSSVGVLVASFAVVEIIEVGNEAAVYGIVTTVATLASPFSTVLSKNVCANFDIDFAFLQLDNNYVRWQVTYTYLIAYGFNLFSLVFLVLLPRQKAETMELKRTGGKSKFMGNLTIVCIIFTFFWSLMTNIMTFSSSTACLKIAGGDGC